jgi:hypothetical protein
LTPGFHLAGGTGLALRYGHRCSVDFDFFARERFSEDALLFGLKFPPKCTLVAHEREDAVIAVSH